MVTAWKPPCKLRVRVPSCYHGYSYDKQNDQSADEQLDWLDVSPAYVVGYTTSNLDSTQQTSNNDSISSNRTSTTLAPDQDVIGSLRNDDSKGNANGKKQQV